MSEENNKKSPRLTYEDVVAAILEVKKSGKNPSINNVFDVLGRGSRTTIQKHLVSWERENGPSTFSDDRSLISLDDAIAGNFERPDMIIPGLKAGSVGSIIAPGSTGKGFACIEMCIDISTGSNLLGLDLHNPAKEDQTLFVTLEDDSDVLLERIHNITSHLKEDQIINLKKRCAFRSYYGRDMSLLDSNLMKKNDLVESLIEIGEGKRLIMLDTLRRLTDADENKSADASAILRILELVAHRTGAAVVFTHHTNKNSTMSGMGGEQGAARGSSVLVDNVRWQLNLTGMSEDEAKKNRVMPEDRGKYVQMHASKMNYGGGQFQGHWLKRGEHGILKATKLSGDLLSSQPSNNLGGRKSA